MPAPTDGGTHPEVESPVAQTKESPIAPNKGRAPAPPQESENDGHARPVDSGDQDIDTAGTDHDDDSPTKSL